MLKKRNKKRDSRRHTTEYCGGDWFGNPIAKHSWKVNRAKRFAIKTKYSRKNYNKRDDSNYDRELDQR